MTVPYAQFLNMTANERSNYVDENVITEYFGPESVTVTEVQFEVGDQFLTKS